MCHNNNQNPLAKPNFKKQLRKNKSYKKDCQKNSARYLHCLCGYKYIPKFTITDINGNTHIVQK